MARLVRSTKLNSRASRLKLESSAANGGVYWRSLEPGISLGYYKPNREVSGNWWVRRKRQGAPIIKRSFAVADDYAEADGIQVLTYADAQRKAITWEREQTERPTGRGLTVGAALALWWDNYESRARSAEAIAEQAHKRNAIEVALGVRKVAELKAEDISAWLAKIVRSGRTVRSKKGARRQLDGVKGVDAREVKRRRQATANRLLATLKAALNFAWNQGKIAGAPVWKRVTPYKGADQPRTRYLTFAEAIRLMNAANPEFRPLIHAAILTGCRWTELRMMRVSHYDPASRTVAVQHAKGRADRRIPLSDEGASFFEDAVVGRDASDYIFTRTGGNAWGPQDQKRPMAQACKLAKIQPAIGFHILRHTYGSLLAQEGVGMAVLASAMGHADSRMTERHYAHLSPNQVADAVRAHLPVFTEAKPKKAVSIDRARERRDNTRRASQS